MTEIVYTGIDRDIWEPRLAPHENSDDQPEYPDALATMMAMQRRHMLHYTSQLPRLGSLQLAFPMELAGDWEARQVHESFRRTVMWCVEELVEAVGLFKGKPWKTHFEAPDRRAVLKEIGDAMHFFFEACLVLGLTPEDLFLECYLPASSENTRRQNGDY